MSQTELFEIKVPFSKGKGLEPNQNAMIDLLADFLFQHGYASVETLFFRKKISAIRFFSDARPKPVFLEKLIEESDRIGSHFEGESFAKPIVTLYEDETWKDKWQEYQKPIRIADHLWIQPNPKHPVPSPKKNIPRMIIEIEPGMAFGTGNHPTTYLCLREMDRSFQKKVPKRFLDLGCGSGILSILAYQHKVPHITSLDIDPEAIEVCKENFAKNGIPLEATSSVLCEVGSLHKGSPLYDSIAANILLNPLIQLLPLLHEKCEPNGTLFFSGLLKSQEKEFYQHLEVLPFSNLKTKTFRNWICIQAIK